jgi:hypothetical protein
MQNPIGGHCVLVIGYSREVINGEEVEFWLIQNTHGVRWGTCFDNNFDNYDNYVDILTTILNSRMHV